MERVNFVFLCCLANIVSMYLESEFTFVLVGGSSILPFLQGDTFNIVYRSCFAGTILLNKSMWAAMEMLMHCMIDLIDLLVMSLVLCLVHYEYLRVCRAFTLRLAQRCDYIKYFLISLMF